ncbi:dihydrofolate reductase [Pedobacter yulinensis]|uniref:Dihydrofolate reductase n=1 Tax=Pedobacter yulinensis TaxID=2126353 RepID=A0A2T3HIH5_9SPHI|nr:dihydrofolate reductase [Pedobacter yulinensis]PST82239.1 dihydrofolate reductase [Pedobacter yulinensis]
MTAKPAVSIIVAMAENRAIGKDNQLLWHLPDDLRHFKKITAQYPVIMGRKTFESIGRALPLRKNIVISRNPQLDIQGVELMNSLETAIEVAGGAEEIFIIGGAEIYAQALPLADKLYLTTVHSTFDADTFFPEIDFSEWESVGEERHEKDEKHAFDFTFSEWKRTTK